MSSRLRGFTGYHIGAGSVKGAWVFDTLNLADFEAMNSIRVPTVPQNMLQLAATAIEVLPQSHRAPEIEPSMA